MHFATLLLLPLLVAADQIPLQDKVAGWFDKAKSYIPTALPNPIDVGAAEVAGRVVERVNVRNWQRKLLPKPDTEEEWMVFLTGGNKSCFGRCGHVYEKWNVCFRTGGSNCLIMELTVPKGICPAVTRPSSTCRLSSASPGPP